jgi:hypothetical protein
MYSPSFALAVLASILYGLVFLSIFYLTFIKHRAWYFTCVVVGAAIEVAGYGLRCYSIKNPTTVVRIPLHLSVFLTRAFKPTSQLTVDPKPRAHSQQPSP